MNIVAKGFGPTISEKRHESDIFDMHFSCEGLYISVCTLNEKDESADLIIHFSYCDGLRYLDEGDLMRYWGGEYFKGPYHIYRMESGGWSNGEKLESGILSIRSENYCKEWFIITANGCVSVLCDEDPTCKWEIA